MKYLFKKRSLRVLAAGLDAVGGVLFAFSKGAKPAARDPRHFLIIRLDHLGDILLASAVPQALKENFPGCRVTFLTSGPGAGLLAHNPFVDEVMVYEAPWFSRSGRGAGSRRSFGETVRELRKRRVDTVLSLRGDLRENFLAFACGAKESLGYGVTGGGFFLTRPLVYREGVHESRHTLDILGALGIQRKRLLPKVYFSEEEETVLGQKNQVWGLTEPTICVQLQAGTPAKQWPLHRMHEFVSLCREKFPEARLLFLGDNAAGFEWLSKFLREHPELPWKDLIGQTTLRELFWVIKNCRMYIGPDSGPAHVAASFNIPTLFLYSGTNVFEQWRSLEECAEFLRHPVPCSPCHETHCPVQGHPCMTGIAPSSVLLWMKERVHGA